jgi:hypothetical protein
VVLTIADAMAGATRYRVDFRDETIGRFETETDVGWRTITFRSRFQVQMPGSEPIDIEESLVFDAAAPFALRSASQTANARRTDITAGAEGYRVTSRTGMESAEIPIDLSYTLSDHLGLELWLREVAPPTGAEKIVATLDFDRLGTVRKRYAVAAHDAAAGYMVRSAAVLEDEVVQLDRNLLARAFSISGIVTLTRDDSSAPFEARTRTRSPYVRVALTAPIERPRAALHLELETDSNTAKAFAESTAAALSVATFDGHPRLVVDATKRKPVRHEQIEAALAQTLTLPVGHPEIERIARELAPAANDRALVQQMLRAVNRYFTYDDGTRSVDLTAAMRIRRGDCTEFADLFTTLARTMGLPSRPVTGLIYDDIAGPGFYLHAWSEVAIDGEWVAVDPTIDQLPIDATHIPFPDSDTGFLRAYSALADMHFRVVRVAYQ